MARVEARAPAGSGGPLPVASDGDSGLLDFLRLVIRADLGDRRPSAGRAARRAGLSLRDMQRRLADAEVSFSELRREAVIERATQLLRQSGWRVTDIGLEVGYSESSNFTRAFRRWTGMSPCAYRRQLDAGGVAEASCGDIERDPGPAPRCGPMSQAGQRRARVEL